ncbi:MAG: peptidase MA family metallohydrolase [Chloroflexi bacterium]|nr:peptidase MA family metallohydrolase [Chloroflexota bacterium]
MLRYFRPVELLPKGLLPARLLSVGLLLVAALALSALPRLTSNTASAQSPGDIELISTEVTSEFQEGIRFAVEVRSAVEIDEIAVRFRIGQRDIAAYEYLEVEAQDDDSVSASAFYRTNTAARYIAPGTIITHHFEVTDVAGTRLETPETEYIYHDDRFEWDEITNGIVTVSYHGPVSFRAHDILDASVQTLEIMGPLLGAGVDDPIRITMYNNWPEMRPALPPASEATRRELITEGQAHSPEGVLLVLGGATSASGVTSHEVTHILVHRAGEGSLGRVPSWLNEGLAEFGNIQPGTSYDNALAFAIEHDRLLPITAMEAPPGNPQDVIIFYGQARSIVQYMIFEYGPEKMRELMATIKSGKNVRTAVQEVYGLTLVELENEWRTLLGVELRPSPDEANARPTPLPTPSLTLLSIDQLRQQGSGGATPVPAAATAAPAPEPTATPLPTAAPEPTAPPTAVPTTTPATRAEQVAGTAVTALNEIERESDEQGGGSCGVPTNNGAVEMSSVALLAGMAWLWFRRRRQ